VRNIAVFSWLFPSGVSILACEISSLFGPEGILSEVVLPVGGQLPPRVVDLPLQAVPLLRVLFLPAALLQFFDLPSGETVIHTVLLSQLC
jgi:hypothetical protein